MRFIIDRFEENFAVVELSGGDMVNIDRRVLPQDAAESDVIELRIDREATEDRKKEIEKLMQKIGGDAQ